MDSGNRRHAEGDTYLHGPALVHQHEAPRRRSYCIYPPFSRPRASSFPLVVGLEPPASVPVVMVPVDRVPPGKLEESCNRAGLKHTPRYSFVEEMAGVSSEQRFTNSQ